MKNKFKYIADNLPQAINTNVSVENSDLKILEAFVLTSLQQTRQYISDKRDNVAKELNELVTELKDKHKKVRYFFMNTKTQNSLRTYYSHEISYVSKELKSKFEQNISGMLLGIGIIINENVTDYTIIPAQSKEIRGKLEYMAMLDTFLGHESDQ